jgi:formylglycine-generating enzyme required for sulfatase activity
MIYQDANKQSYHLKCLEVVHGLNFHNFKKLNLQKKWVKSLILFCSLLFLSSNPLKANNLVIGTPTVVGNNIAVTISWDNSWSTTVTPANFDAVWVFVKRQACSDNLWGHALVSTVSGNHAVSGGVLQVDAVTDGMGVFVRRSSTGNGNIATATLTLALQTAANGTDNFQVFGMEMVNIPQGDFFIGDNGGSGSGQNGWGFRSVLITNAIQTAGIGAANVYQPSSHGSTTGLPSTFPLGWNSFYSMKYEISQQQYASFLNSLTFTQQLARTNFNPASAVGTYAIASAANPSRNFIKIKTSGVSAITPAVYGCDLNNNGVFDEASDGQNIGCNWLAWSDLMAYLDWAALRPMTEFEFEKICRGAAPAALNGEYAWNSVAITQALSSSLNNAGQVSETSTASGNGLCAYGGSSTANGPLRCGFAAGVATNKAQAGGAWFGVMEMSGNVWEQCLGGYNGNYSAFTTACGDGALTAAGAANTAGWPASGGGNGGGGIIRGGGYDAPAAFATISDRGNMTYNGNQGRVQSIGGRGVR